MSASSGRVSARPGVLGEVTIRATAMDGSGVYAEQKIQIMPAVVRVELTPGLGFVMDLETAQPVQLSAACLPKEAAQTVTWRSSNPNYADVDANGMLTAKRVGTVLVTATAADGTGRYATLRVTVGKTVKELALTGAEQLTAGQSTMLMASFTPKDASIRTLRWTSDQPSIASVSSSGQVRTMAGRYGEALITATATDGSGASATHRVTVMAAVTGVTITAPKTMLDMNDPADMALQLTAACNEGAPSGIQWSTSNAAIATVDETGLVTPHAGGEVIILAKSAANASRWASVKLTILAKAAEVSVSWAGLTWYPQFSVYALNCTRTVTLKATVAPANANQTVTWSSSDPSIARIDAQTGALEALSDGLVTITATAAGGMVGTLKVWSRDEATLLMPYLTCAWQSGADGIYLAWQPVSGARARARYCVYLDGEYIELPAGQMSYTATGLSVGKHSLAVTPMVELGGVAFAQSFTSGDVRMVHVSKIAGDAYLAPIALVAAAPNPYTAELRWSPANPQALPHGYTIESLQQGVWVKLQTTQELSVRLTGQPAGERIYRVAPLVNATGGVQTGLYATVRVTILASENSQYLPPVGLYAMSSEANTVALAWTPADPPDRYVIYRKNGAAWVEVGTSALGKATLTSQPGGGQTYRVNAQVLEQGQYHTGMAGAEVVVAVKAVSKYRALLVGQQNYAQSLVGIDDDLAAMTEVLTHGKTAYEVNSTMNLSKSGIFNAIQSTFAGASSEDVSLFYYGGHGANSVDNNVRGALYLTSSEYLTGAELANALNKVPGTVIVILESCFSGNTIWDGTRARTLTPEPTDEDLSGFNHSMINAFSAYGRAAARSGELRTQKFHVLTTAAQNQNGLEFQYNNGVGFGLLTRGLAQCAGYLFIDANKGYQWAGSFVADEDGDGCITVAEAYSCAKPLVKNWAYNTIVGGKPQAHTQDVQVWPSNSTQPLLFR
ncbi:MAG: Ig-like domain-containing protein [Clostridia bacterium]